MQPPASSVWNPAAAALAIATLVTPLLGLACKKSLPSGPSELATGITIYEDANYLGRSAHLTRDVRDLKDFNGPCEHVSSSGGSGGTTTTRDWNDCVSSIRVAAGWQAVVYRDDDFDGDSLVLTTDTPNLQLVPGRCDHEGMNDCITSIRIAAQ
jgi:hypothetical protein